MSGGVMPVLRDRVDEFLPLRKDAFGFELVPLPRSLQLVAADSLLNPVINPHVRANSPRATGPSAPQSLFHNSYAARRGRLLKRKR